MRRSHAGVPVFRQLYLVLEQRIRDGILPPDHPIPAEPKLAADHGVARVTVRRALALLEKEGLVERRRGIGTFPRARTGAGMPDGGRLDNLVTLGFATRARTLAFEAGAIAPPFVAAALDLAALNAATLHIERLRLHEGETFSLTNLWLPESIGAHLAPDDLGDRTIIELMEERGFASATAKQALSAVAADPRTAQILGATPGAPLLRLRRIVFSARGAPHLYQQSLYRPDRYEYKMELSRVRTAPSGWSHAD
jgi:GntR family transcriptional regulator